MLDNEILPKISIIDNFIQDGIENLYPDDPDVIVIKNAVIIILRKLRELEGEIESLNK